MRKSAILVSGSNVTNAHPSSTIIDNLLDLSWVTAYFYFDTNDTTKQDLGQLLNSLVTQLSALSYEPDKVLDTLYVKESNGKHPPRDEDLIEVRICVIR